MMASAREHVPEAVEAAERIVMEAVATVPDLVRAGLRAQGMAWAVGMGWPEVMDALSALTRAGLKPDVAGEDLKAMCLNVAAEARDVVPGPAWFSRRVLELAAECPIAEDWATRLGSIRAVRAGPILASHYARRARGCPGPRDGRTDL